MSNWEVKTLEQGKNPTGSTNTLEPSASIQIITTERSTTPGPGYAFPLLPKAVFKRGAGRLTAPRYRYYGNWKHHMEFKDF
jgi:hypothetical protein